MNKESKEYILDNNDFINFSEDRCIQYGNAVKSGEIEISETKNPFEYLKNKKFKEKEAIQLIKKSYFNIILCTKKKE